MLPGKGRSKRSVLAGRLFVPAMLCTGVGGACAAQADIIYSSYGPNLSYNADETSAPIDGGAYISYDGPIIGSGELNQMALASFVTPDQDYLPTQVTLAVDTWQNEDVFIVPDINGVPAQIDGTFLAQSGVSALNHNLNGFNEIDGNITIALEPAVVKNSDDTGTITRELMANTRYWIVVEQELESLGNFGFGNPRSDSAWFQSTNPAPADSVSSIMR